MKTTTNFEKDLIDSCASAAEFLRKKDEKYNKLNKREGKDRLYSSEAQFVAEVYRLLVKKNECYRMNLFVNYLSPGKEERQDKVIPDLVFRNGENQKSIVEVKVPVDHRANGSPEPMAKERMEIESDYAKLKKYYKDFNSKFLVVAYLGDTTLKDGTKFPFEDFSKWIHNKCKDTDKVKNKIKVIVC